jgi:hypothetical protein
MRPAPLKSWTVSLLFSQPTDGGVAPTGAPEDHFAKISATRVTPTKFSWTVDEIREMAGLRPLNDIADCRSKQNQLSEVA